MSEGAYGETQALVCGCVGACTCFSEPYQDTGEAGRGGKYWFTADANGQPYVMTNIGWVDAYSAEGQSVLNDPSNYATVVVQGGDGYWYSVDANGFMYLWTTSGWQATAASVEIDPNTVTIGPPTVGSSETDLLNQVYASGDPALIEWYKEYQEKIENMNEIWLNEGGEPDKPLSDDWDQDSIEDNRDWDPYDSSVQDPLDVPAEPDPYEADD